MKRIELRVLQPEDWAIYKTVRLRSLKEEPDAFCARYEEEAILTDNQWKNRLDPSLRHEPMLLLLALTNDIPAAIALGLVQESDPTSVQIYQMWVNPEQRRLGLGKALLDRMALWAKALELNTLALSVITANAGALRLYEQYGFRVIGTPEVIDGAKSLYVQRMRLPLDS